MRFFKRLLLVSLILFFAVFIFREWIFGKLITYRSVSVIKSFPVEEKTLKDKIEKELQINSESDIREISLQALKITTEELQFSSHSTTINPNQLIHSKKTHCVGYAAFFTTVCNYILVMQKMSDKWRVKHRRGKLYFIGINIHTYFDSKFFGDHDFVSLENKETGEIFAVDPSVHEYLRINFIPYIP